VDADSVDVLMVELHDEFITMTFGTFEVLVQMFCTVVGLPVLALLKHNLRNAVVGGALLLEAIMESVSELLEV
jgi:hypothetical protein